jgi:hypothetical protein
VRRRAFITLVGGATAWPLAGWAQQSDRMRRVGVLQGLAADDQEWQGRLAAFRQASTLYFATSATTQRSIPVRAFAFGHRLQAAHTSHAAIPPPRQAAGSLDDRAERERDCGGRYWPVFSLASPPNSRPRMTSTM